jgi:hypothetical protein
MNVSLYHYPTYGIDSYQSNLFSHFFVFYSFFLLMAVNHRLKKKKIIYLFILCWWHVKRQPSKIKLEVHKCLVV